MHFFSFLRDRELGSTFSRANFDAFNIKFRPIISRFNEKSQNQNEIAREDAPKNLLMASFDCLNERISTQRELKDKAKKKFSDEINEKIFLKTHDNIHAYVFGEVAKSLSLSLESIALLYDIYNSLLTAHTNRPDQYDWYSITNEISKILVIIKKCGNPVSALEVYKILRADNFVENELGRIDSTLYDWVKMFYKETNLYTQRKIDIWDFMTMCSDPVVIVKAIKASSDKKCTIAELVQAPEAETKAKELLKLSPEKIRMEESNDLIYNIRSSSPA